MTTQQSRTSGEQQRMLVMVDELAELARDANIADARAQRRIDAIAYDLESELERVPGVSHQSRHLVSRVSAWAGLLLGGIGHEAFAGTEHLRRRVLELCDSLRKTLASL